MRDLCERHLEITGMEAWHILEGLLTEFSLPVTADVVEVVEDLKEIIRDAVSQIVDEVHAHLRAAAHADGLNRVEPFDAVENLVMEEIEAQIHAAMDAE